MKIALDIEAHPYLNAKLPRKRVDGALVVIKPTSALTLTGTLCTKTVSHIKGLDAIFDVSSMRPADVTMFMAFCLAHGIPFTLY